MCVFHLMKGWTSAWRPRKCFWPKTQDDSTRWVQVGGTPPTLLLLFMEEVPWDRSEVNGAGIWYPIPDHILLGHRLRSEMYLFLPNLLHFYSGVLRSVTKMRFLQNYWQKSASAALCWWYIWWTQGINFDCRGDKTRVLEPCGVSSRPFCRSFYLRSSQSASKALGLS